MQIAIRILNRWTRRAILALLTLLTTLAHGQGIPALINYQGRLTDTLGNPVTSGYYEIEFRLWDDATLNGGGNLVWARSFPLHVVTNGLFNVLLSDAGGAVTKPIQPTNTLLKAFDQSDRYLGLTITLSNGVSVSNLEISPRQQLASAPFAVHAQTASSTLINSVDADSLYDRSVVTDKIAIGGVTTTNIADGAVTAAKLANNVALLDRNPQTFAGTNIFSRQVTIGANTPKGTLRVEGDYYGKGHIWLHAYEGDGSSGTAYVQARDDSGNSSIALQLRSQHAGSLVNGLLISTNGNVGIGTTAPASTLHVNGSVTVDNGPVSMFGALQTMQNNLQYTASTDGLVLVTAYQKHLTWYLWGLNASSPTIAQNEYFTVDNGDTRTLTIPVAKGEKWQVNDTGSGSGGNYLHVYWRPIGK